MVSQQKQRDFSPEYKRAVMERIRAGASISGLSQELGIARQVLYRWRDVGKAGKPIRRRGCPRKIDSEPQVREQRIAELQQLVGQLTEENRFFRGALQRIKESRQPKEKAGGMGSSNKSKSKSSSKAN